METAIKINFGSKLESEKIQRCLFELKIPWCDSGFEIIDSGQSFVYIIDRYCLKKESQYYNVNSRYKNDHKECKWVLHNGHTIQFTNKFGDDFIEFDINNLKELTAMLEADKMGLM